MKLAPETGPYLHGEAFSRGLDVGFSFEPEDREYVNRQELLVNLCRGKRVIHAGCVDHSVELIREKSAGGTWLHGRIAAVASRCVGVDIAAEGVAFMRDELGYAEVLVADIADEPCDLLAQAEWDYLLLPELVEHVDDPVRFMRTVGSRFCANVARFVVTVPNALSRGNYRRALKGREVVNSDHRYWFTPYTIAKVLARAGLGVERILFVTQASISTCGALRRFYYSRRPLVRDSIVVLATLSGADPHAPRD